ncbi:MAG: hypothetical protein FJY67_09825, partial [Calditrichaeota bacterium]|nr:hypothetical protein [Calditrichota bacterium]
MLLRTLFTLLAAGLMLLASAVSPATAAVTAEPIGFIVALEEGDTLVQTLTLRNEDDAAAVFEITLDEPEENVDRRGGPRRDQPEGRGILIQNVCGWSNWNFEQYFSAIDGLRYSRYRQWNEVANVDFNEFDFMWIGNYEPDAWVAAYNENFARIEEFVDRGGALYRPCGTNNHNTRPRLPGGLTYTWGQVQGDQSQNNCPLQLNPEDNFLIDYMNRNDQIQRNWWRRGAELVGNGNAHGVFLQQNIDRMEGVDWVEVMAIGNPVREPIIITYKFGRGRVVASTTVDGFLHNNPNQYQWGRTGVGMIWYLDHLAKPGWLEVQPDEGEIAAGESAELELIFVSTGLEDGTTELILSVLQEGIDAPVAQMSCVLTVQSPVAAIAGLVTDEATGDAMPDVQVELDRYIIQRPTDEEGAYDFADLPLGAYELTFSAPDYLTTTREVNLEDDDVELNVAMLHSTADPDVGEEGIFAQLEPDNTLDLDFNVANNGNGPLSYRVERRLLGDANAEPWTIRRSLNVGAALNDDRIEGALFIGDNFYLAGAAAADPNTIYILDRDGDLVDRYNQAGNSQYGYKDLEWDGELIWGSGEAAVFGFTPGGDLEVQFAGPYNPNQSIAWDSDRNCLWIGSLSQNDIIAYDREGNRTGARLNRRGLRTYGMGYWPDDPDGYPLYIMHSPGADNIQVHKMNPANGDTLPVRRLQYPAGGTPTGVSITNQYDVYSWVFLTVASVSVNAGRDRLDIYQLDARKDWFGVEPVSGVIEAGDAQRFDVHLSSVGLPLVDFEGELVFLHDGVGGETHVPVTLSVVEGRVRTFRNVSLVRGWNLMSVNLQPEDAAVEAVVRPLVEAGLLDLMKDGSGHFYRPRAGFNNIPDWESWQGYWLKLNGPAVLRVEGESVLAEDGIALGEGWNMVAYYPRRSVNAVVALSGVMEGLLVAKDGLGNFYVPAWAYSNMGNMGEGRGYQLKMEEGMELVYRTQQGGGRLDVVEGRSAYRVGAVPRVEPTGRNMSLLLRTGSYAGVVGVYSGGLLVGTGYAEGGMCGVAVWGDDPLTTAVEGAMEGGELTVVGYGSPVVEC